MQINFKEVLPWLTRSRADVAGDRLVVPDNRGVLIYRDHGSDVLLIAHLDWVGETDPTTPAPKIDGMIVRHPSLDDRLGCWAIETLAAHVGADLLFTDCEERGASTGADFSVPHLDRYRFMLMFDRMGTDSVLYQYDHARRWRRAVSRRLGPVSFGSYSCISAMSHVGVCGLNVGIGYHDHNGPRCWADLRLSAAQIQRAASFVLHARSRRWRYQPPRERRRLARTPTATVSGLRLCIACSYALRDGEEDFNHACPMVADCDCCAFANRLDYDLDLERDGYKWR